MVSARTQTCTLKVAAEGTRIHRSVSHQKDQQAELVFLLLYKYVNRKDMSNIKNAYTSECNHVILIIRYIKYTEREDHIMFALPIIIVAAVILFIKCVRIVPQASAWVVEFLGSYHSTLDNGLHFTIPILQRVVKKVSLKEQVEDFPPQPVITKDNVTMKIDTVVYFTIFDPKLFTYGVENPIMALENLTATTLRNIVGDMELDQTLTSRDIINTKMQSILDPATDKWGIRVNRVELKNIIPPQDIQNAMEKQMKAEREKRQTLLEAEAHREASIKRAQGDKEAAILNAQADSESAITRARGEAESIRLVYEAKAAGMRLLSETKMSESALMLKKLEALQTLGDGRATKIVVPTDLSSVVSDLSVKGEALNITKDIDTSPKETEPVQHDDPCCDDEERSDVTKEQAIMPRVSRKHDTGESKS